MLTATRPNCSRTYGARLRVEQLEQRETPAEIFYSVSNLEDTGRGSLRAALTRINGDLEAGEFANGDTPTVTFTRLGGRPLAGTITLQTELPKLKADMLRIDGPGAGILTVARSATATGGDFRIFTTEGSAAVQVEGLTVKGGRLTADSQFGGGLFAADTSLLSIDNCVVANNHATAGGGGVANASGAKLFIEKTKIQHNTTTGNGGGVYARWQVEITEGEITGNVADGPAEAPSKGGGIYFTGRIGRTDSKLKLIGNTAGVLIQGNTASVNAAGTGAGLYAHNSNGTDQATKVEATNVKFRENKGGGSGSAVYNFESNVTLTGCLMENNTGGQSGYVIYDGSRTVFLQGVPIPIGRTTLTNTSVINNVFLDPGGTLDKADQAAVLTPRGDDIPLATLYMNGSVVTGNDGRGVQGDLVSDGRNTATNSWDWSVGWVAGDEVT